MRSILECRTPLKTSEVGIGCLPGRTAEGSKIYDLGSMCFRGKLLWSMTAGSPILPLWYHHDPEFELEAMFPGDVNIRWARWIVDRVIVQREQDCIQSAGEFLRYIDRAILALRRGAQVVG